MGANALHLCVYTGGIKKEVTDVDIESSPFSPGVPVPFEFLLAARMKLSICAGWRKQVQVKGG